MDQRIYHGSLQPTDLARPLLAHFNRGNLRVQQIGSEDQVAVQISTPGNPSSGGQTAISVTMQKVEDGVLVRVGQQAWLGIAASLGITALGALRNPFSLLGRLDDLAQDIEHMRLTEEVWRVVDSTARDLGTGSMLSERLRRMVCEYCDTANPVGEPCCIACGAPLGSAQPDTCMNCGFIIHTNETICPNCGKPC